MIDIQVFAGLKDYFPATFNMEQVKSIADLKSCLEQQQPHCASLLSLSRFAVNEHFVSLEHPLNNHDKVAILPPASGG
jgi:molybdopterin converting factor small subunit